jgi:hypothetical protein
MKAFNLTGTKVGRLLVLEYKGKNMWFCRCDCGKEKLIRTDCLKKETTKSCGCLNRELAAQNKKIHGMSKTPIYKVYRGIKSRCFNKNIKEFFYYGNRGISVCDGWLGVNGFESFYIWAMSSGYRAGLTLERINNNGNYEPDNCTWATMKTQCNNTRHNRFITYNGRTQTYTQWETELGYTRGIISSRVKKGWSIEEIMTRKPVKGKGERHVRRN